MKRNTPLQRLFFISKIFVIIFAYIFISIIAFNIDKTFGFLFVTFGWAVIPVVIYLPLELIYWIKFGKTADWLEDFKYIFIKRKSKYYYKSIRELDKEFPGYIENDEEKD